MCDCMGNSIKSIKRVTPLHNYLKKTLEVKQEVRIANTKETSQETFMDYRKKLSERKNRKF